MQRSEQKSAAITQVGHPISLPKRHATQSQQRAILSNTRSLIQAVLLFLEHHSINQAK
jgi:hypothetical protein